MPLPPLESREQLTSMLDAFYGKVRADALIGPVFDEIARVSWEEHLPKIHSFWDTLLFGADSYQGRPFPPHLPLNLQVEHFHRWLALFFETVDERHSGFKAEEIKTRAYNIGQTFYSRIEALREGFGGAAGE